MNETLSKRLNVDCDALAGKVYPILQANHNAPPDKVLELVRSGDLSEPELTMLVNIGIDTMWNRAQVIEKTKTYHNG
jgi:hypothetical protein